MLVALALGLLAVVAGFGTLGIAEAHAVLVSSDPPDGARLDEAPEAVRLTFSERVSADLGGIRVIGTGGARVDEGAVRVDGPVVSVDLADDVAEGSYVVTYRIVSADGHPVRGATVFGVGPAALDPSVADEVTGGGDDERWELIGAVGRGIAYGGTLLAAGGALFLVLVHQGGAERRLLVRTVWAAAVLGALGSLVALPVQAALGTGQGASALFDDGVLAEVASDGVGLGIVLALAGLAAALVGIGRSRPVAVVGALVASASFAATGHTRTGEAPGIATVADAGHLVVVATWGGGVVLLLLTVWARRRAEAPAPDLGELVVRFAAVATVGVLGAAGTGAALAWHEVGSLDAVTGTGYGQLLLVKLGAVAVVAAAGAYNHLRLVPAVRAGKLRAALRHLRPSLAVEAAGLLAVLGLTAVLVVVTPGRTEAAGGPVERIIELGEVGSVQLVVDPARAGFNEVHLYTYDAAGRPAELAETIEVELALPAADLGPIQRTATRAGPAHAQLDTADLAVGGTWDITVRVRVDRFTEASGTAQVPVAG